MSEAEFAALLDLIYEAPLRPAAWARVMETLADRLGGTGAWLSRLDVETGDAPSYGILTRVDTRWVPQYLEHFGAINPFQKVSDVGAYVRGWKPRILVDEEWIPKDELLRTEYYNDFQKPQNFHSTLMIRLALRGLEICVLNIMRPESAGQFQAADLEIAAAVHPHLIRAFNLSEKVAGLRLHGEGLAGALDEAAGAVLLISADGTVRHANRAAERLLGSGPLTRIGGRLQTSCPSETRRLETLIGRALARDPAFRGAGEMAVRRAAGLPLSLSVAPLAGGPASVFVDDRCAIVMIADLEAATAPSERRLRELFGLSPAEVRLAKALFEGMTLKEAACAQAISFFTARNRLALINEKTQTHGQVELARLLSRVGGVAEDPALPGPLAQAAR